MCTKDTEWEVQEQMVRDSFAVFILSHGRADNLITLNSLRRCGYSGKWYVVVDNEDPTIDDYVRVCGSEHVIVFDKLASSRTFDAFDNSENRKTIIYARNECFRIARELGLKYFLELDDDYKWFEFRWPEGDVLKTREMKDIDRVFEAFLTFLDDTDAKTIAFAQGGDLIGGVKGSRFRQGLLRKAMNSFFCRTDRPFTFIGRINEDVNTYTTLGSRGDLFFTFTKVDLVQVTTQKNNGGMSDVYLDYGTYNKSFYTVITMPSCVKIGMMGDKHMRIHHQIDWETCVPKIVSGRFRNG